MSSLSSLASLILDHCRQVKYSVGSALFYRLDLWHHGTRCLPERTRRAMQFSWRRVSLRGFAHAIVCAQGTPQFAFLFT